MGKILRHIVPVVLIAMLIVSCGRDRSTIETLTRVESIMQEHPDSALSLLQAIDTEAITTDRCRALHALLLSQAYDKNYIDLTSDSLISIAINYYADTDDHRHAMLAHYYRGRIYENDGDIASCIIQCLDAEKRALLINDYFYLGMIYGTIADCYNKAYNFDEERNYALRSLESFKKTSNELYIKYAYLSYGVSLVNCKKYSDAEKFYEELLKVDKYKQDNIFYRKIISNFIHLKWINKDYQAIRKILYSIKNEYECDATTFAIIADLYRNENKIDSAQSYLSNAKMLIKTDREKAITKHVEYDIMCDNQNYAQARKQLSDLNKIQNDAIRIIWEQSVIKNQRDLYRAELELNKLKQQHQLHTSILIGGIIIIVFVLLVYRWNKKYKQKLAKNITIAQNLREIMQTKASETQHIINNLLASRFDVIDGLCKTIYESRGTGLDKKKISTEIEKLIKQFSSNSQKIAELETFANEHYSNIITSFKTDLPNLKEADYLLFLYTTLGFSITAIALFLNEEKVDAVYNRKARLKNKIRNLGTSKYELYAKYLQ